MCTYRTHQMITSSKPEGADYEIIYIFFNNTREPPKHVDKIRVCTSNMISIKVFYSLIELDVQPINLCTK